MKRIYYSLIRSKGRESSYNWVSYIGEVADTHKNRKKQRKRYEKKKKTPSSTQEELQEDGEDFGS